MPQIFQVLKCYDCKTFQVHQTKKATKFECKLCGKKQSIKRHYGLGNGQECRLHVQKLNEIRGEVDNMKQTNASCSDDDYQEDITEEKLISVKLKPSKWTDFIEKAENTEKSEEKSMYLNNTEVVLELPKKSRKQYSIKRKSVIKKFKAESSVVDPTLDSDYIENKLENDLAYTQTKKKFKPPILLNKYTECSYVTEKHGESNNEITCLSLEENTFKIQNVPQIECKNEEDRDKTKQYFDLVNSKEEIVNKPLNSVLNKINQQTINKNSKWAQYIDEDNEIVSDSDTTDEIKDISNKDYSQNSKSLFTLCDDNDLDNILDI